MSNAPTPDDSPLRGARDISQWLELLLVLAGVFTTLFAAIREKPWIIAIGVAVIIASVAWYLVRRAAIRRRRPRIELEQLERGGGAYLRGLLPFERGEKLLGRGRDVSTLLTKLRSRECRFAYVSGDAGVGKTSLIRSAVLTELIASGYLVVYCPKTGRDPIASARQALREEVPEARIAPEATLPSALRTADAARQQPVVIVWDQFEEFFIAHRTVRDRRPFLEEIGHAYQDADLRVRFVVSLRREFVDDLRDLAEWIPRPLDDRFSHRVRNWDAPEAAAVLEAAAAHDDVPFAAALREAIVSDLEQAGEVRPVELQLVASRLVEQRIYDVPAYESVERARGVLESYVNEIIQPPNTPTDEKRERVARFVLRLLCADTADAKRPIGLTFDEIVERVTASIGDSSVPVRELAAECLEHAVTAYLVILEDEDRYNLRHDYLARPILDAAAGAQTIEQRANRVLDHYLERARSDQAVTIPRRDLRLIRNYSSPQRKSEPASIRLILQSRRRHTLEIVAATIILLVLTTVLLPPSVSTSSTIWDTNHDQWLISLDGTTAVSFTKNGSSRVWRVGTPWTSAETVAIAMRSMRVSPRGTWVAGITDSGAIHVWKVGTPLRRDARPALQIQPLSKERTLFLSQWGDFSPDENWFYAFDLKERLFLWHPGETLGATPSPFLAFQPTEYGWPQISFSPRSTYIAVAHCSGNLYLKGTAAPSELAIEIGNLKTDEFCRMGEATFSKSERWLVYEGESSLWAVDLRVFPPSRVTFVRHPTPPVEFHHIHATFAPDEEQVAFGAIHLMTWKPAVTVDAVPTPTIAHPGNDMFGDWTNIEFSRDGRWIAAIGPDYAGYVVPSNTTPGAVIKPVIPRKLYARNLRFSPTARLVAATTATGVFVFEPGTLPKLSEPIATLPGGGMHLRWSVDDQHLYAFSDNEILFGDPSERFSSVRARSEVTRIVTPSDRKTLIVFSRQHLTIVQRRVTLWLIIRLRTLEWPQLVAETKIVPAFED